MTTELTVGTGAGLDEEHAALSDEEEIAVIDAELYAGRRAAW